MILFATATMTSVKNQEKNKKHWGTPGRLNKNKGVAPNV
jgi:hypothetical protein